MTYALHVTVGRPSSQKANGVLQVVSAYVDNDVSGVDQLCFYMSRSVEDIRRKYTNFNANIIGVLKCFYAIYQIKDELDKIYLYGGCQWRILLLVILMNIFFRNELITIYVPSGAYSKNSFEKRNILKRVFVKYIEFHIIKSLKYIQALSTQEKRNMLAFLPTSQHPKVIVIPNAVRPLSTIVNDDLSVLRIIYVGRKDIQGKGIDLVAEAVRRLEKMGTKVYFSIYGPSHSKESDAIIDTWVKSTNGVIKNYGSIYGQDKVNAFSDHNIFVLASSSEGLPTSLIEAAQTGIICLATKETNLEEDDWSSGIVEIERNIDNILRTLNSLIDSDRPSRDIDLQKKHFSTKYDFANIRAQHDQVFSDA